MGCGTSKTVAEELPEAPDAAAATTPTDAENKPAKKGLQQVTVTAPADAASSRDQQPSVKQKPKTKGGRPPRGPPGSGAVVGGGGVARRKPKAAGSSSGPQHLSVDDDDSLRASSAMSTKSAPAIIERPSSRGGMSFEITMEGPVRPRRLESIQKKKARRRREELTLEELQAKLEAAETRRVEIEKALQVKMQQQQQKSMVINRTKEENIRKAELETAEKSAERVSKAEENRAAHLKKLADQLNEKKKRREEVLARKRQQAASEA
eukprot:m.480520 g.480520  ORF g.480520 m.480520 type:complete len:265 (-) comp21861_c0_seq1:122-916(-)